MKNALRLKWLSHALFLLPLGINVAHAADRNTAEQTAEQPYETLDPVVVTAVPMSDPLVVVTDPKAPRQPVPAHDGADYLKTIPGFTVIRKGGTDGDPVFRGMAGSRLNILVDGEVILGGCGGRMDPPTAYIFPESYDEITVLKGPQSVVWGPGASAATVLFERKFTPYTEPDYQLFGSAMLGSFGRNDQVIDLKGGTADYYGRLIGTRSSMNDYKDGNGQVVHSQYNRWSGNMTVGATPAPDTRIEFNAGASDGEAAYADRGMDGSKFNRQSYGLRFEKKKLASWLERIDARIYYNYIDHVMDNYSLRDNTGMKMANNPDRRTMGLRLAGDLNLGETTLLKLGVDQQNNQHRLRNSTNQDLRPYQNDPRIKDATFDDIGIFSELTQALSLNDRLVAGLRVDFWRAQDKRVVSATSGQKRTDTLPSGFVRYEHDYGDSSTFFVGIGHSERFPDYWETVAQNKQSETGTSAFDTKPEKNTQLDIGTVYQMMPNAQVSLSLFYSRIDDYILIDNSRALKDATLVRNIDATTYGGEAGFNYRFARNWNGSVNMAYVRGTNDTDHTALAQLPPLDTRFGLDYDDGTLSAGALWRVVAEQNRFDVNKGNIAGQDIGRTPGFGVFSLNAGYRPSKNVRITAGVDNLFDKTYAESISRSGAMVSGFDQTTRVNEPGRNYWLKLDVNI